MVQTRRRYWLAFGLLAVMLVALFFWNVCAGSLALPVKEVLGILFTRTGENAAILWQIRIPRILAVVLLGGALSVSGFLLQTFFANPIASPFVLGISSGSRLAVSLLTVGALSQETGMSQGNTSNLCKRLERSGYLERARDFRDERVVTLSLTQGGRDTLERIRRRFARYGQILDQLPQADRDAIQQGVDAAERAMDYLAEQIKGEQTQC